MAAAQFSVFATCALFLSCSFALDPHQLELKQHYEHLAYIADFPCLHPQPRVITVNKLFSEEQSHGKAYFPDVTVLHRCDECTGSCTSGHSCVTKVTELVLLPFKATYLYDTEKHQQGSWEMEYHELLNHTECSCAKALRNTHRPGQQSRLPQSSYGSTTTSYSASRKPAPTQPTPHPESSDPNFKQLPTNLSNSGGANEVDLSIYARMGN